MRLGIVWRKGQPVNVGTTPFWVQLAGPSVSFLTGVFVTLFVDWLRRRETKQFRKEDQANANAVRYNLERVRIYSEFVESVHEYANRHRDEEDVAHRAFREYLRAHSALRLIASKPTRDASELCRSAVMALSKLNTKEQLEAQLEILFGAISTFLQAAREELDVIDARPSTPEARWKRLLPNRRRVRRESE
jgi:hypothetical protein